MNPPRSESGRFDSAEEATVVVIGGANIDHKSQTLTRPEFGTSNPGRSRTSAGGVGRNVAENLARLGVRTVLVSAIGNDAAGVSLRRETESAGVDLAHSVAAAGATGSYTAILDASGEMVIAVSAMETMDELTPDVIDGRRDIIRRAGILVLDCNVPQGALLRAAAIARDDGTRVIVDPVSVAKATRITAMLAAGLPIHTITPNRDELIALVGTAQSGDDDLSTCVAPLHNAGVENVWVRLGPRGSFLSMMRRGTQQSSQLAPFPATLVDATGAGDAMLAGYAAGLVRGFDVAAAADYGRAAAAVTVESPDTVSGSMNFPSLRERVAEHTRHETG